MVAQQWVDVRPRVRATSRPMPRQYRRKAIRPLHCASSQSLSAAISGPTTVWSVLSVLKLGSMSSTHIPVALHGRGCPTLPDHIQPVVFPIRLRPGGGVLREGVPPTRIHLITSMVNVRSGVVSGRRVHRRDNDHPADASTPTTLILGGHRLGSLMATSHSSLCSQESSPPIHNGPRSRRGSPPTTGW